MVAGRSPAEQQATRPYVVASRVVDVTAATVALFVLSPFLLLLALAVKLTSAGPAVFRSRRVDRFGREFYVTRFRTMYLADRGRGGTTPIGRLLRRSGFAEAPRLASVVLGHASLRDRPVRARRRSITIDGWMEAESYRRMPRPRTGGVQGRNGSGTRRLSGGRRPARRASVPKSSRDGPSDQSDSDGPGLGPGRRPDHLHHLERVHPRHRRRVRQAVTA